MRTTICTSRIGLKNLSHLPRQHRHFSSMATAEQHPPILIDTVEKLDEALNHWKNTTFSQHYLKLGDVVESLRIPRRDGSQMVDARQEYAARWLVSRLISLAKRC